MNRQGQKRKGLIRLITLVVITAMVCQNMAWARGMDYGVKSALAPNRDFFKDASSVNLKMAKIGEEFIDKIAECNERQPGSIKTIPDLFKKIFKEDLLKGYREKYQVDILFNGDSIELIDTGFSLAFVDSRGYPDKSFYHIPGTEISVGVYKKPLGLPSGKEIEHGLKGLGDPANATFKKIRDCQDLTDAMVGLAEFMMYYYRLTLKEKLEMEIDEEMRRFLLDYTHCQVTLPSLRDMMGVLNNYCKNLKNREFSPERYIEHFDNMAGAPQTYGLGLAVIFIQFAFTHEENPYSGYIERVKGYRKELEMIVGKILEIRKRENQKSSAYYLSDLQVNSIVLAINSRDISMYRRWFYRLANNYRYIDIHWSIEFIVSYFNMEREKNNWSDEKEAEVWQGFLRTYILFKEKIKTNVILYPGLMARLMDMEISVDERVRNAEEYMTGHGIEEHYSYLARFGWNENVSTITTISKSFRDVILSNFKKNDNVLSIGCGTVEMELKLLRFLKKGNGSLMAIDNNPQMIEVAKTRGVPAILGDAHNIPFGDSSFDKVSILESAGNLKIKDAFSEVNRVLRQYGEVIITTYNPKRIPMELYYYKLYKIEDICRELRDAGFEVKDILRYKITRDGKSLRQEVEGEDNIVLIKARKIRDVPRHGKSSNQPVFGTIKGVTLSILAFIIVFIAILLAPSVSQAGLTEFIISFSYGTLVIKAISTLLFIILILPIAILGIAYILWNLCYKLLVYLYPASGKLPQAGYDVKKPKIITVLTPHGAAKDFIDIEEQLDRQLPDIKTPLVFYMEDFSPSPDEVEYLYDSAKVKVEQRLGEDVDEREVLKEIYDFYRSSYSFPAKILRIMNKIRSKSIEKGILSLIEELKAKSFTREQFMYILSLVKRGYKIKIFTEGDNLATEKYFQAFEAWYKCVFADRFFNKAMAGFYSGEPYSSLENMKKYLIYEKESEYIRDRLLCNELEWTIQKNPGATIIVTRGSAHKGINRLIKENLGIEPNEIIPLDIESYAFPIAKYFMNEIRYEDLDEKIFRSLAGGVFVYILKRFGGMDESDAIRFAGPYIKELTKENIIEALKRLKEVYNKEYIMVPQEIRFYLSIKDDLHPGLRKKIEEIINYHEESKNTGTHLGTRRTYDPGFKPFNINGEWLNFDGAHREFVKEYINSPETIIIRAQNGILIQISPNAPPEISARLNSLLQRLNLPKDKPFYFYLFSGKDKDQRYGTNPYCLLDREGERLYIEAGSGGKDPKTGNWRNIRSIYMTRELFEALGEEILCRVLPEEITHAEKKVDMEDHEPEKPDIEHKENIMAVEKSIEEVILKKRSDGVLAIFIQYLNKIILTLLKNMKKTEKIKKGETESRISDNTKNNHLSSFVFIGLGMTSTIIGISIIAGYIFGEPRHCERSEVMPEADPPLADPYSLARDCFVLRCAQDCEKPVADAPRNDSFERTLPNIYIAGLIIAWLCRERLVTRPLLRDKPFFNLEIINACVLSDIVRSLSKIGLSMRGLLQLLRQTYHFSFLSGQSERRTPAKKNNIIAIIKIIFKTRVWILPKNPPITPAIRKAWAKVKNVLLIASNLLKVQNIFCIRDYIITRYIKSQVKCSNNDKMGNTGTHLGTRRTYELGFKPFNINGEWLNFDGAHREFVKEYIDSPETIIIRAQNGILIQISPNAPPEISARLNSLLQRLNLPKDKPFYFYLFSGKDKDQRYGKEPYCLLDAEGEKLYLEAGSGGMGVDYSMPSIYMTKEIFMVLNDEALARLIPEEIGHVLRKVKGDHSPEKFEDDPKRQEKLELVERYIMVDRRPVDNRLLAVPYIGHDMAVKEVINPENKPLVGVYGGAGADISNFLLSTNAGEGYFVDPGYGSERWVYECFPTSVKDYLSHKYKYGYAQSRYKELVDYFSYFDALILELQAIGVSQDEISEIRKKKGDYYSGKITTIRFHWAYPGEEPKERIIHLIKADIINSDAYPDFLKDILSKGIDFYYQRAGLTVALKYCEFVKDIASYIKPEGFMILDNYTIWQYTEDGEAEEKEDNPLDYIKEVLIEKLEPTDDMRFWADIIRNVNRYNYGWNVKVYKRLGKAEEESQGLCVTGDTLLSILRLAGEIQNIELKQIVDVKPGDCVFSLNEKTKQIEPHRINGLLDMGIKPVYRLTTASGRSIKTTANHPYLTRQGWIKVSRLKEDDEIGVPNEHVFQLDVCENMLRQGQRLILHKLRLSSPYLTSSFSRMNEKGDKDSNYSQNAKENPQVRRKFFKEICRQSNSQHGFADIYYGFCNKFLLIFCNLHVAYLYQLLISVSNIFFGTQAEAAEITPLTHTLSPLVVGRGSGEDDILWDRIISIEYIGYEHVYDIEVEGTHNFIGNGIFAHNTYMDKLPSVKTGPSGEDKNITCGTVCESGHEGSWGALDSQLERQFEELRKILRISKQMDITEEEADMALVKYAKKFGIEVTFEQLQDYRRQIKAHPYKLSLPNIFFSIPETGTELFWVGDDYAGGHFNELGTRIHISLPIILNRGIEAGIAIAKHDLAHIQGKGHQEDEGLRIVERLKRTGNSDGIKKSRIIEDNVYSFSQKVDALINESVGRINTILDLDGKDKMIQVGRLILERLDIRGDASDMVLSMAWHVRDGLNCHLKKKLGMDEEFKGKIIYSLSALLNGALNGKEQERFAEKTRGRVFFYVGKGFSPHEGHKYLEEKGHVVNKENLGMKIDTDELVIFMLSKEELEDLGIKDGSLPELAEMKTDWAKEGFKAFIIPIKERGRNVSNDISLGLELIRSRGEPKDLPDLFKSLLIIYLKEAGYSREDMERLCGEEPISACDYKDMIEESYNKVNEIINSA